MWEVEPALLIAQSSNVWGAGTVISILSNNPVCAGAHALIVPSVNVCVCVCGVCKYVLQVCMYMRA